LIGSIFVGWVSPLNRGFQTSAKVRNFAASFFFKTNKIKSLYEKALPFGAGLISSIFRVKKSNSNPNVLNTVEITVLNLNFVL
jgi:hypothetical protein